MSEPCRSVQHTAHWFGGPLRDKQSHPVALRFSSRELMCQMNLVRRKPAPPARVYWKPNVMAAPMSTNRFSVQPRNQTSAVSLAEPTNSLEVRPKVGLQAARRQLACGLAERTVGHARVDAV